MLSVLVTVVGVSLVVLAVHDAVATVVSVNLTAGPVTRRLSTAIWSALLWLQRRWGLRRQLALAGPTILVAILGVWVVLLIVGWAMVFGAEGVTAADTDEPLALLGRVYYAASIITGRGSSSARPSGDGWQALEEVAGMTGIALLGLSISYVLSVVGAVVDKRRLASYMSSLGRSPQDVLERAWDGRGFGELDLHLIALTPMLAEMVEQYLAYPVVHHFYSPNRHSALAPALVTVDEVVRVVGCVVADEERLPATVLEPLRVVIDRFLELLDGAFVDVGRYAEEVDTEVDQRALVHLESIGIPVADEPLEPDDLAHRRRVLRGLLVAEGWSGSELLPAAADAQRHEGRAA